MKRKFKQWWSKIPPINKMNNHFSPSLTDNNKKDRTTYDIENPGPGIALLTWENYVIDKRNV